MNFYVLFILFFIYSFIGWIVEVLYALYRDKHFINRGFLIGPYCPIYGIGCILMITLLKRYINDIVVLFVMSMVICSILEYITSFVLEKIFKARWWNYSDRKFNINGRVCLETLIPFGMFGCIIMYIVNPFIMKIIKRIPSNGLLIIFVLLLMIFVSDLVLSIVVLSKINLSAGKIIMDDQKEITKRVKDYIYDHSWFGKRLIKSFPHIKIIGKKKKK